MEKREVIWMASHLRTILQDRKELKDKEIILVDEKRKELGYYAIVYIKPVKINKCRCKNYQFKSSQFIYRFGHVYLVSDTLKRVGGGCVHYNYEPTQDDLGRDLKRFLRATNPNFFQELETKLEKQFEQAFGAD
jgi:hypothetical protein